MVKRSEILAAEFQRRKRLIAWGAVVVVALVCAWGAVATYATYQKDLPSIERVYNIEPALPTVLYDRHGVPFKQFYRQRRVLVPYDSLPSHLIESLLATEDRSFYDHWGFRWTALLRGTVGNVLQGRRPRGGSTLTQQLARHLFLTPERTIARKIKEVLTAIKLERTYSKVELLEMYLNQHYFGSGAYGVEAAAMTYFGKHASDLDLIESATIVGLLPAPTRYSPRNNPDLAIRRRNIVLASLKSVGDIDQMQFDSLAQLPVGLQYPPEEVYGTGEYFAEDIRRYLEATYGVEALYTEGWHVATTLDFGLQRIADSLVRGHLDSLRAAMESRRSTADPNYTVAAIDSVTGEETRVYKKMQAALVAVDNATGDVIAMVGGHDFGETKFNRATQMLRQPGSAFKPFVLTAAIEAGFKPTDTLYDTPLVLNIPGTPEWRPHNFDLKFKGPMTLREGIAQSRNLIAIKLLQRVSPQRAIFYAHRFGITSKLRPGGSLAIGTSEVTPIELAEAISVFPNKGIRVHPRMVRTITDRFGNVIERNEEPRREEVLSERTAFVVTHVMQSVVKEGTGRGARRRGFTRPAGGKTGTSDSYMDNWFVGFTPQITCVVWVGYDLMAPIGGYHTGTGAATALPVWTWFMKAVHDTLPPLEFEVPDGVWVRDICTESGQVSTTYCTDLREEVFTAARDTLNVCVLHGGDSYRPRNKKRRILPF